MSVCLSIRPYVCQCAISRLKVKVKGPGQGQILGARLCRVQQRTKKSNYMYQSRVFVCLSNNHADAVDRLLIA